MECLVVEGSLAFTLMTMAGFVAAKLRLSLVPLLVATGIAIGPHLPSMGMIDWRFAHSAALLAFMGRLGLVCLVFALGLECPVGWLHRVRRSMVLGSAIYVALQGIVGLAYAGMVHWPWHEVLIVAGILTMSSRAIVAHRVAHLQRTGRPEIEMLQGIRMCEGIVGVLYLAGVAVMLGSRATPVQGIMTAAGVMLGCMLGALLLRRYTVLWLNRALHLPSNTTCVRVLFGGWCLVAGISETLHMAEVVGALLAGLVLAETEHQQRLARLIQPFRDFLGAFFFFSFGLTIDPAVLPGAAGLVLGAVGCTLAGTLLASRFAGRAAGLSSRASYTMGLTLVARGEFALILASLGEVGGLVPVLQPFAALYVLVLALIGLCLAHASLRLSTALQALKW